MPLIKNRAVDNILCNQNKGSFEFCKYRRALYLYCFRPFVVRSCLELFCFLSFVSFVLRHLCSGTHRRNQNKVIERNDVRKRGRRSIPVLHIDPRRLRHLPILGIFFDIGIDTLMPLSIVHELCCGIFV